MDRSAILELMAKLKLFGMRAAYDEVMATAIKRQYEPARIIGELLAAEIAEKQARSIKYQLTLAKFAYSDDVGRAFRLMSATCSDRSRPAVRIDVGRGGGAPAGRM